MNAHFKYRQKLDKVNHVGNPFAFVCLKTYKKANNDSSLEYICKTDQFLGDHLCTEDANVPIPHQAVFKIMIEKILIKVNSRSSFSSPTMTMIKEGL